MVSVRGAVVNFLPSEKWINLLTIYRICIEQSLHFSNWRCRISGIIKCKTHSKDIAAKK